ncbi:hypothetical protein CTKA_02873 [Chthonomonas calidirosea]|uniref:Uncharacterized protein n=1 Tax=Chthonomonas calidirosea (strain DSM 23976 / ICMP 18418 / T49) TaxID=1303518 RepID=S0ETX1_CHTCT|nr:hypothetical protein [Chthonomonas calidirosea]CCW35046.1 hypothetical protein CCALI_01228 [Chthonomonas calidirosea T49]CEK20939.1 hypothetical protein CTKA_02873 [Chthonomonas calidirosea]
MFEEADTDLHEIPTALKRMHLLAQHIQCATERNDFSALQALAAELPALLEQCQAEGILSNNSATLRLVTETCFLLDSSAERVEEEMRRLQKRLQKLRRGRRLTAVVRAGRLVNRPAGRLKGEF